MLEFIKYENKYEDRWDRFVLEKSRNGTFLQTRRFLSYHPTERFTDASLMVLQGGNIAAVIPSCEIVDDGKKCFFSHKGSTFGSIVLDEDRYNISFFEEFFPAFEAFLKKSGFEKAVLKNTSDLFCKRSMELLDYFLYQNGYEQFNELGFYIDMVSSPDEITELLSGSRRRDYRYSLKNELQFVRLEKDQEVRDFYCILCLNLARHNTTPVHSIEELLEWKNIRFHREIDFYGVYHQEEMIAGTMLFYFENRVLHTQYLAQNAQYAKLYPMNFLNVNLIQLARERGFEKFSFGISTENHGKVLNKGLALFKEGFGCDFCINRTYLKDILK